MKKPLRDVDGKEIPGYTIEKKRDWKVFVNTSTLVSAIAFTVIVVTLLFLWWLTIYLLTISVNWIFNTDLFTFWKMAVLVLVLGTFGSIINQK